MAENQESWATRIVSTYLANDWYGVAEDIVTELAGDGQENPFDVLAGRLEEWVEEQLLLVSCPKPHCYHTFQIDGTARWVIVNFFLGQVNWDAVAREYEEDLVREGGTKIDDYHWEWEEADGGEYDDEDELL